MISVEEKREHHHVCSYRSLGFHADKNSAAQFFVFCFFSINSSSSEFCGRYLVLSCGNSITSTV